MSRSTHITHVTDTTRNPPMRPPTLTCPTCPTFVLEYVRSFLSGARTRDQWDQFVCAQCDRVYEYRQRTGQLRLVLDAVDSRIARPPIADHDPTVA